MKKAGRYAIRAIITIVLLFIVLWIAIWGYIRYNKSDLLSRITSRITEKTRAEARVDDLTASWFKTFPFISLELTGVQIKDSLWRVHNRTFLSAENVYLRLSPFGLFNKNRGIGKVIITNGNVRLFADSTYQNQYILRSDNPRSGKTMRLPDIELRNSELVLENPSRNKLHHFHLREFLIESDVKKDLQLLDVDADVMVKSLAFNTKKGSYVKNKNVVGDFSVTIDRLSKKMSFEDITLLIDEEPFRFTGIFSIDTADRNFNLSISSTDMNFDKTIELLPDSMRLKIKKFSIKDPVVTRIDIVGETRYKFLPLVNLEIRVKNNTINTPGGTFYDCSFLGKFNNELVIGDPRVDMNSVMELTDFSARFEKIPLTSKRIRVSNLRSPYLECDLKSSFKLSDLNELTGSSTLQFLKGNGSVDVVFHGPISGRDSVDSGIDGIVSISNATLKYIPRNVLLSQCTGKFLFKQKDLHVEKFFARTGDTELHMNGDARNFLSLLDISPEKLVLRWNVFSPHLHLQDFRSFLARRNIQTTRQKATNNVRRTAGKIDKMFTDGDVFFTLSTPRMDYKRFDARKVDAQVLLTSNRIDLKNVSFGHANGSMKIVGTVTEGTNTNAVFLNSTLNRMDIPSLFYAFGDFGQDAITTKNLRGIVSADVNLNTAITHQAEIIPESMMGTVDFLVENGELKDFEPLQKISLSVFRKQDFQIIKFADLKNRLQVKGTAIIVDKMEIRSTALILFAEGVYDVKKGTDMSIKFPIRNIIKKNDSIDLISSDIRTGPSIRVRAKTGEDGKLKITWDPFRRSVRNKRETESN